MASESKIQQFKHAYRQANGESVSQDDLDKLAHEPDQVVDIMIQECADKIGGGYAGAQQPGRMSFKQSAPRKSSKPRKSGKSRKSKKSGKRRSRRSPGVVTKAQASRVRSIMNHLKKNRSAIKGGVTSPTQVAGATARARYAAFIELYKKLRTSYRKSRKSATRKSATRKSATRKSATKKSRKSSKKSRKSSRKSARTSAGKTTKAMRIRVLKIMAALKSGRADVKGGVKTPTQCAGATSRARYERFIELYKNVRTSYKSRKPAKKSRKSATRKSAAKKSRKSAAKKSRKSAAKKSRKSATKKSRKSAAKKSRKSGGKIPKAVKSRVAKIVRALKSKRVSVRGKGTSPKRMSGKSAKTRANQFVRLYKGVRISRKSKKGKK